MSRRFNPMSRFDARSLMLIASVALGAVGSAQAQSTAAPASAASGAEVKAAFTKADKNADGKLSRDEAASLPAVAANFDKVDADKDGSISEAEFGKSMKM